jgi:hypothetical protein
VHLPEFPGLIGIFPYCREAAVRSNVSLYEVPACIALHKLAIFATLIHQNGRLFLAHFDAHSGKHKIGSAWLPIIEDRIQTIQTFEHYIAHGEIVFSEILNAILKTFQSSQSSVL